MTDEQKFLEDVFIVPGSVRISDAALNMAQETRAALGAGSRYVLTFDWAQSIAITEPGETEAKPVGPCLTLSGYDRVDVPPDCIVREGELEFAVRMPREVLAQCEKRFIDVDETKPFRLALL